MTSNDSSIFKYITEKGALYSTLTLIVIDQPRGLMVRVSDY